MILLDTHVLVWWVRQDFQRLTPAARAAIDGAEAESDIIVSSITAWETALLAARGRVVLDTDTASWFSSLAKMPALRFIDVDNAIGIQAVELPEPFHKDPADRLIVATARRFSCPVVTADEQIRAYPHVRTIW